MLPSCLVIRVSGTPILAINVFAMAALYTSLGSAADKTILSSQGALEHSVCSSPVNNLGLPNAPGSEIIIKGDQVRVPSETLLEFTLQQDVSIAVKPRS
jgi:hypothetical protein